MTDLGRGETISNRYEVLEPIAEGGRRVTYRARDTRLDRTVALSVVRPECIHLDPTGVEREAKVLGRIGSHDSLVSVLDVETSGEVQFVVLDYLPGGTLVDQVAKQGPLPLESLLRLGRQVCQGLSHLHSKGLVHRDVAAKNVLLDERGGAHLGDFDCAIRKEDFGSEDIPVTPNPFAAPEEQGGSRLDHRSDLYSFGCLLYVMALGADELGPVDELRAKRSDLPTSFADLVEALLEASPAARPESAEAVLAWLDDIGDVSNIEALVRAGESQQVEFKGSLRHLYNGLGAKQQAVDVGKITVSQAEAQIRRDLEIEITKTIAAFLNSDGGMLLIGVDDHGHILGIEADLQYFSHKTTDAWLQTLQNVIIQDLGADTSGAIRVSLVPYGDVHVAVVSCPRRATQTWQGKKGHEVFYVRSVNGTRTLTGPELLTYSQEHWPK